MSFAHYPVLGKEQSLPFYLTGIGEHGSEYHVTREEGLFSHQFLFTKSGSGILKVNGEEFLQNEGSFFYLSPGIPHEYYPLEHEWNTCWVVFRGDGLGEILAAMGFPEYFSRQILEPDPIYSIFNRLYRASMDMLQGGLRASGLIYHYILEVQRQFVAESDLSTKGQGHIAKSLTFIHDHFHTDLTLDMLVQDSGVSKQHFCRLFRAAMGMRPMEYVAGKRIAHAKMLLDTTDFSIHEVGMACGYPDLTYFGIVFKKQEGISPGAYRRLSRSSN